MKTDGIILDVDGTLWNTTEIVAVAWNEALKQEGLDLTVTGEMLKGQFGKPMDVIADNLFGDLPKEIKTHFLKVCCQKEHIALNKAEEELLYPGVKETFQKLSKRHKLYIVSNCQAGYIELFLEKNSLFEFVSDIECFGNNGNSKGKNISLLVNRNRLTAPVYVGDTQGDKEASEEAGVPFIFAAYGFGEVIGCMGKIESFDELPALIDLLEEKE